MAGVLNLPCAPFNGVTMIEAGVLILSMALLNRLGGSRNKLFRRIGIPLLITLYGLWRHQWLSLLSLPYGFAIFCLPITLVGDDITAHWYNWAWLPVLGFLIGFIPFSWQYALIYSVIFTILVVLSNHKKTAEIFKWQYVELIYGGLLGLLTYNVFLI